MGGLAYCLPDSTDLARHQVAKIVPIADFTQRLLWPMDAVSGKGTSISMSDDMPAEHVPSTLSGPDAPFFPPTSPAVVLDLALIEGADIWTATERANAEERAAAIIADAEARASKLIAAAVADAEDQVADVRPQAEAEAAKIRDEATAEADTILERARSDAERILSEAEGQLTEARNEAAELIEQARRDASQMMTDLTIDRNLATERLDAIAEQERALAERESEVERTLTEARLEAERLTGEAAATADRLMRAAQQEAEARRKDWREETAQSNSDHSSEISTLTEGFEAELAEAHSRNDRLREEVGQLRADLARALSGAGVPTEESPVGESPIAEVPKGRSRGSAAKRQPAPELAEPDDDPGFVSPWMVPDEELLDPPSPSSDTIEREQNGDETPDEADEQPERKEEDGPSPGIVTGLAPNTRLVEPLSAAAFRSSDADGKRRRSKRRR